MACLSDVMNFFVRISGREFSAMTTNNLKQIGFVHDDGIQKRFSTTDSGFEDPMEGSENSRRNEEESDYLEASNRPLTNDTDSPLSKNLLFSSFHLLKFYLKHAAPSRNRDDATTSPFAKSNFSQLR